MKDEETLRKEREDNRRKEQKRQENANTYHQIFLVQRDRATQLKQQLEWMAEKQLSKQSRIAAMKRNWSHLRIGEKFHFKNLKNSLKRLEVKINKAQDELKARSDLIVRISELQQHALSNPNPMCENPCLADFEQSLTKEWSINTTPVAPERTADERPSTRSLMKRLHPKAVIDSLQKKLGKKSKSSRPLGAHHSRIRSRTENMQEVIPPQGRVL